MMVVQVINGARTREELTLRVKELERELQVMGTRSHAETSPQKVKKLEHELEEERQRRFKAEEKQQLLEVQAARLKREVSMPYQSLP